MDLVQFLRDRLDEDAAAANRVESRWRQVGETGVIVASDGGRAEECANGNWTGIAEHIVRHDPARVLAEVEAKRRIVDDLAATIGGDYIDDGEPVLAEHLLRLLALPYADHPDYFQQDWKP